MGAAGGDSLKIIDPEAFNEEARYEQSLHRLPVRELLTQHDIKQQILVNAVQGSRGMIGRVLDVADKIAYTARDPEAFLSVNHLHADHEARRRILGFLAHHPDVCTLWDTVRVSGGEAIFTDTGRLETLLRLRALMFRTVYWHPRERSKRWVMRVATLRDLYRERAITSEYLLQAHDHDVNERVDEALQCQVASLPEYQDEVIVEQYANQFEAEARYAEVMQRGNPFAVLERVSVGSGTSLLVELDGMGHLTFHDADPAAAREIEQATHYEKPYRLFYLRGVPAGVAAEVFGRGCPYVGVAK